MYINWSELVKADVDTVKEVAAIVSIPMITTTTDLKFRMEYHLFSARVAAAQNVIQRNQSSFKKYFCVDKNYPTKAELIEICRKVKSIILSSALLHSIDWKFRLGAAGCTKQGPGIIWMDAYLRVPFVDLKLLRIGYEWNDYTLLGYEIEVNRVYAMTVLFVHNREFISETAFSS